VNELIRHFEGMAFDGGICDGVVETSVDSFPRGCLARITDCWYSPSWFYHVRPKCLTPASPSRPQNQSRVLVPEAHHLDSILICLIGQDKWLLNCCVRGPVIGQVLSGIMLSAREESIEVDWRRPILHMSAIPSLFLLALGKMMSSNVPTLLMMGGPIRVFFLPFRAGLSQGVRRETVSTHASDSAGICGGCPSLVLVAAVPTNDAQGTTLCGKIRPVL